MRTAWFHFLTSRCGVDPSTPRFVDFCLHEVVDILTAADWFLERQLVPVVRYPVVIGGLLSFSCQCAASLLEEDKTYDKLRLPTTPTRLID